MFYNRYPLITIHHLRIFAAVSRQRRFARAAEGICLSQPAVSAQIKELEPLLGVRLLLRSQGRRQIDLMPAGEVLLASCAKIAELLERTNQALSAIRGDACSLETSRRMSSRAPGLGTGG